MNDADRTEWVDNDEGLYNWWLRSGLSKRQFIQANRAELTRLIEGAQGGRRRFHDEVPHES